MPRVIAAMRVVLAAPSAHTATLVFCHGLGDTAEGGWADAMPELQAAMPGLKVILPNAPVQPVTLNGGMPMPSWHDIHSLNQLDTESFKDDAGIIASQDMINRILEAEISAGTPSTRIILGGFSQGAALSLFTGLQSLPALGGVLALSGYLPLASSSLASKFSDANKETPVLMLHGDADQVVRHAYGQQAFKAIQTVHPKIEFKSYRGMGHHSSMEEMRDVAAWIKKILA